MKNITCYLAATLGLAALTPFLRAAEDQKNVKTEKKDLRVLAAPDRERRVIIREGERREKMEMEQATFLGIEASSVPPTLSAQLGLPRGTGLVVGHVAPKSAAAGVLQQHDILLKLDDQILIEAHQLAVLVRNHKEGDEVTLTYLRAGQRATAKVKLGTHEVPKMSALEPMRGQAFGFSSGAPGAEFERMAPGTGAERAHVDRLLSTIRREPGAPGMPPGGGPPPARIFIDRTGDGRPGLRAMAVNPNISTMVINDDDGSLELSVKEGVKSLVAKDPQGAQLFSGPVSTPEERKALPAGLRERLERLEGMREMTFKTDGDFQSTGTWVERPRQRSISLPGVPAAPKRQPGAI